MPQAAATNQTPYLEANVFAGDAAFSSGAKPINSQELLSIYAFLAVIAQDQNIRQEDVQARIEAAFGVDHVSKIQRRDFRHAMEFLNDLHFDEMRSKR